MIQNMEHPLKCSVLHTITLTIYGEANPKDWTGSNIGLRNYRIFLTQKRKEVEYLHDYINTTSTYINSTILTTSKNYIKKSRLKLVTIIRAGIYIKKNCFGYITNQITGIQEQ